METGNNGIQGMRLRLSVMPWLLFLLVLVGPMARAESEISISGPESPYLSGTVPFSLDVGKSDIPHIAFVSWYLDGRLVHRSETPSYRVLIDLGPDVLAHRISATAFSAAAAEHWSGEFRTLGLSVAYSDKVSLVVVPVTVLHPEGYFHTGLGRESFRVYEDGVQQNLACFANDVVPLRVALLVDSSKSMRGKVRDIRKAARTLIDRLALGDAATVMSFDDDLVRHCAFTGEKDMLYEALKGFGPGGGTSMYDALYGTSRIFRESEGKRVIILFTDGQDETYRRPAEIRRRMERAISAASRANITVYTIGLGRDVDDGTMETIADTTGGAYFHLGKIRDLAGAYGRIFDELGSQYTLCYRPVAREDGTDSNGWRKILVEVEEPGLIVRHKKGYSPSR